MLSIEANYMNSDFGNLWSKMFLRVPLMSSAPIVKAATGRASAPEAILALAFSKKVEPVDVSKS